MNLLCPNCQKMLTVPEQFAGQLMKCPLCAGTFTVPGLPPASSPPPPDPAPAMQGPSPSVSPPQIPPEPAPPLPLQPPPEMPGATCGTRPQTATTTSPKPSLPPAG